MVHSTLLFALAGLSGLMDASPVHQQHKQQHQHRAAAAVSGKRGVAFPKTYTSPENGKHYGPGAPWTKFFENKPQISWMYDWEAVIDESSGPAVSGLEYIPLLHSNEPMFITSFKAVTSSRKSKTVFSINEPDQYGGGGAGMTIDAAVQTHKDVVQPLVNQTPKPRIGAPAVTNGVRDAQGRVMGIDYLEQFKKKCTGCHFDFMVAHWYGPPDVKVFKSHIGNFSTWNPGKPVWVTEFGVDKDKGTEAQVNKFLQDAMEWMDSQSWIEKYAYHMAAPDVEGRHYMVKPDMTGLTSVGNTYVS